MFPILTLTIFHLNVPHMCLPLLLLLLYYSAFATYLCMFGYNCPKLTSNNQNMVELMIYKVSQEIVVRCNA